MTTKDKVATIIGLDGLTLSLLTGTRLGYNALVHQSYTNLNLTSLIVALVGAALFAYSMFMLRESWRQKNTALNQPKPIIGWALSLMGVNALLAGLLIPDTGSNDPVSRWSLAIAGVVLILLGAGLYMGAKFTPKPQASNEKP